MSSALTPQNAARSAQSRKKAREWLEAIANRLICLVIGRTSDRPFHVRPTITASAAAALIPEALGLTPQVLNQIRATRDAEVIGRRFACEKDEQPDRKVDTIAGELAEAYCVSKATVYRLGQRAVPDIDELWARRIGAKIVTDQDTDE
jgi:hypothetical protein